MDEYSGSQALQQYFRYDNSRFEQSLKRRGFFVPSCTYMQLYGNGIFHGVYTVV